MPNDSARSAVRQHVINLDDGKPDIDRNRDHPEPSARINQFDILGRVGKQDGEPIPFLETGVVQSSGEPPHAIVKLGESERGLARRERGIVGIISDRSAHGMDIKHSSFLQSIPRQIRYADHLQRVLATEADEIRQAGHGSVIVRDFADYP